MCGDGLQLVTSLKQVTGASLLKGLYLSVRLSHILFLSFTNFHFLNGAYSSVGNSQKTKFEQKDQAGNIGSGCYISGEKEPVKSIGIYLSIVRL